MSEPAYYHRPGEKWPTIIRAVVRDDGVHLIEHNGHERAIPTAATIDELNERVKKFNFPVFVLEPRP